MSALSTPLPGALADAFRPAADRTGALYDVALVVGASLFVAATAQVAIPMPSGVPITGQTFGVLLVAALLGPTRAGAALVLYTLQGLAGLPVFAGLTAGVPPFSFGYILGFIPAAVLVGALTRRGWDRNPLLTGLAFLLGTAVIFLFGLAWLSALMPVEAALAAGLTPYLPGAAIKIALAMALLPVGWRVLRAFGVFGPR